jgi:hypothetical protein
MISTTFKGRLTLEVLEVFFDSQLRSGELLLEAKLWEALLLLATTATPRGISREWQLMNPISAARTFS